MDGLLLGTAIIVLFILLVVAGLHLGVALWLVGILGLALSRGWVLAFDVMRYSSFNSVAQFGFAVLPLFMLMGELYSASGLTEGVFGTMKAWIGHIRGGLGIAVMMMGAALGAASGSSTGTIAMMSRVAFPQMKRVGYDKDWTAGIICAAGPIAEFIPPSDLLVIYGILSHTSIGQLLLGGVVPGIILTVSLALVVHVLARRMPSKFPIDTKRYTFSEKIKLSRGVLSIVLLILAIIGGLYLGIFSPSEAGAIGAFVSFVMVIVLRRRNSLNAVWQAIWNTVSATAMAFFLIMGALYFSRFIALSGVAAGMMAAVSNMQVSPWVIYASILFVYLILGCFMSSMAMMAITLPVVLPIITQLGYSPISFGIVMIMMCEIGAITPPFGVGVFITKAMLGNEVTLWGVFRKSMVFVIPMFAVAIIIIIWPQIVLWLPSLGKA